MVNTNRLAAKRGEYSVLQVDQANLLKELEAEDAKVKRIA
jgi:hypothetical protein